MLSISLWYWACSPLPSFKKNVEINTGVGQGYSDTYPKNLPSSICSQFRVAMSQRHSVFLVSNTGGLLSSENACLLPEPTQTISIQNFPWKGFPSSTHWAENNTPVLCVCSPHSVLPCSLGKNGDYLVCLVCRAHREKISVCSRIWETHRALMHPAAAWDTSREITGQHLTRRRSPRKGLGERFRHKPRSERWGLCFCPTDCALTLPSSRLVIQWDDSCKWRAAELKSEKSLGTIKGHRTWGEGGGKRVCIVIVTVTRATNN